MKRKRGLLVVLLGICIFTAGLAGNSVVNNTDALASEQLQKNLADNIIRFHIRAYSDSTYDQNMKLYVKDKTVTYMTTLLKDSDSLYESREIINNNIYNIKQVAVNAITEYIDKEKISVDADKYSEVKVYFERSYFPMKVYDDIIFPPGEYEAFRIDIGEAQGKNWWCVLYPPLCFVDSVYATTPVETKEKLKNFLTDDEYSAITNQYEYRFKILTFLNDLF